MKSVIWNLTSTRSPDVILGAIRERGISRQPRLHRLAALALILVGASLAGSGRADLPQLVSRSLGLGLVAGLLMVPRYRPGQGEAEANALEGLVFEAIGPMC